MYQLITNTIIISFVLQFDKYMLIVILLEFNNIGVWLF